MKRKVTGKDGRVRPYWLSKSLFRWLGLDPTDVGHERAAEVYLEMLFSSGAASCRPADEALLDSLIPGAKRRHEIVGEHQRLDRPTVLITGSGMCEGGPIAGYLADSLTREDVTIAFCGYLSSGTLGAKLSRLELVSPRDRARLSEEICWTHGEQELAMPLSDVRARFVRFSGFSAHADQDGLVRWILREGAAGLEPIAPTIFVQHGTEHARRALAQETHCARAGSPGVDVIAPDGERWFDLDAGKWLSEARRSRADLELELESLRQQLAILRPTGSA